MFHALLGILEMKTTEYTKCLCENHNEHQDCHGDCLCNDGIRGGSVQDWKQQNIQTVV